RWSKREPTRCRFRNRGSWSFEATRTTSLLPMQTSASVIPSRFSRSRSRLNNATLRRRVMRNNLLLITVVGVTALVIYAGSHSSSPLRAQADVALTGLVISEEEDRMEGVVVTARKEGSPISISVVTDAT